MKVARFLMLLLAALPLASRGQTPEASSLAALDLVLSTVAPDQEHLALGDALYQVSALRRWRTQLAAAQEAKKNPGAPQPLVTNNPFNAWTGGIVYYTFNANVTAANQQHFLDAAAEWATYANLQFIPRTAQPNYTEVKENGALPGGGQSAVGMFGGMQLIQFSPDAWNRHTLLHEIGHTLGMQHEHQRPDRDTYVTILSANYGPGQAGNFVLLSSAQTHGTPYDFRSVMHYARDSFSINPLTLNTIEPKPAYSEFLNVMGDSRSHLSAGDRAGIALLYGSGPALSSVVTNTKDSGPGSLRQCLAYALDNPGTTVTFNIPQADPGYHIGDGVWTIKPTGALPALKGNMVVDASTQPGNTNPNGPEIVLSGVEVNEDGRKDGFLLIGSGVTIRGFVIQSFPRMGIRIEDGAQNNLIGGTTIGSRNVISGNTLEGVSISGAGTSGNMVQGNYIGTNTAGTAALANGRAGISIFGCAQNNTIGGTVAAARNVISGNTNQGLTIYEASTNANIVQGNHIGTNASGTAALANGGAGISIYAGAQNSTIGGTAAGTKNVISGNTNQGLTISEAGTNGSLVQGNYIGTNAAGTAALANGDSGISIYGGAQNNTIGGTATGARNLLSGNTSQGLTISEAGTNGNLVQGNHIGTNTAGTAALANGGAGISIYGGAQNNTIGGTSAGARNVLSGNNNDGLTISEAGTNATLVQGNYIGTNAAGTAALANGGAGISIFGGATANTIGGSSPGLGNVISGNFARGVVISGAGSNGNSLFGNLIGLNASGTGTIPNPRGIEIFGGPQNNAIGGSTPGSRNFISGNTNDGIAFFDTTGNSISGNTIGLDLAGDPRGNGGSGVVFFSGATSNTVGGGSGSANHITRNSNSGVALFAGVGTGNAILGNRIVANNQSGVGWQEIDLLAPGNFIGANANDLDDPDAGPNGYQNFPVLTSALLGTSGAPPVAHTVVSGSLNSNPSTNFTLQFFANSTAIRAAEYFIGSTNVTTNASGDVTFTNVALASVVPVGWRVTATATSAANNTSEFSAVVTITTTDTDGDGMPDAYESGNGLNPAVNDAALNSDGDGWTNIEEMRLGTHPQAYSAGLDLSVGGDLQLTFPTVLNKIYQLRASHTLGAGARWIPLADGIVGTGGTVPMLDPQAASLPRQFYQLLQLP